MPPPHENLTDSPAGDHRRNPRRRGEELERAIFAATLAELAEVGYSGLTMERVAVRARTGKATLYRRWPGRAELVVEAYTSHHLIDAEPPDTGDLRADVIATLQQLSAKLTTSHGDILRGLLAETARNPDLARVIRERVHTAGPGRIRGVLCRAVARGDIEPWVLTSRRASVAVDLIRDHFLLYGAPIPVDVITEIVDDVYLPLLVAPRTGD
ncbi:TetR/AcrR family transcriptional regulator [Streptomyces griseoviridis]|uniref:TetR family transcriptional regulator n=2 Tax=Streptomyces TaxID=1883 RepID=A0A3Q9KSL8_STRGD|nr:MULTISPECIES: TetR/AcrR family transcriptional regulator [Streptomyces]AZS83497.1 TetR/AcrR family transcriptional regulator [Streptomyces griseoviridis]MDH6696294.1 AcrR family transcriptional regulator [Streptomyces sp. MAA16]MDT0473638.1 TetR/AcrR family transcriptional regulator [Streptomyces sp. DSM 41014]QCN89650.1 TetR family transcriptional regulator [Streptomyces griseoviridis]